MGHAKRRLHDESIYYKYYLEWLADAKQHGYERVDDAIKGLYREKKSMSKVAACFGVTRAAIYRHLHRLNEPVRPRGGYHGIPKKPKHFVGHLPLKEWCRQNDVCYATITHRLRSGMTLYQATREPVRSKRKGHT